MSVTQSTDGTPSSVPQTNVADVRVVANVDVSVPVGFYDRARRFLRRDPSWKRGPGADDAFQHTPRAEFAPEDEYGDAAEEEVEEDVPQRLRPRQPMALMTGTGNYHGGENRSVLASSLPLVEHGRGEKSGGRHCEPTTMPVGVAWGDGLASLSSMLPLNDPCVVRAPKSKSSSRSVSPMGARGIDLAALTPMNQVALDDAREGRVNDEHEQTFSPMGSYSV